MLVTIDPTKVENAQYVALDFEKLFLCLVFFFNPLFSKTIGLLTLQPLVLHL